MNEWRNKLTKEQLKKYNKNYAKAKEYFNLQKGYVLHHKDIMLRHNNIERYIEWRPEDLEVMTMQDHLAFHAKEHNVWVGRHHSEEAKQKMSEAHKGKTFTEEHKRKIGEAHTGMKRSEETKRNMSKAQKGHEVKEETRKKLSNYWKGKHWYTNGYKNIMAYECPEGYYSGRTSKMENKCITLIN